MQSIHSSLENEPVDLSGLHESVVDSDEEDIACSLDVSFINSQISQLLILSNNKFNSFFLRSCGSLSTLFKYLAAVHYKMDK
jgi:hypothetical protein